MRTTLKLDDDVAAGQAAILKRLRESGKTSLKTLVNEALRRGLREMIKPSLQKQTPYRSRSVSLGRCHTVSGTLAWAEGENFK